MSVDEVIWELQGGGMGAEARERGVHARQIACDAPVPDATRGPFVFEVLDQITGDTHLRAGRFVEKEVLDVIDPQRTKAGSQGVTCRSDRVLAIGIENAFGEWAAASGSCIADRGSQRGRRPQHLPYRRLCRTRPSADRGEPEAELRRDLDVGPACDEICQLGLGKAKTVDGRHVEVPDAEIVGGLEHGAPIAFGRQAEQARAAEPERSLTG